MTSWPRRLQVGDRARVEPRLEGERPADEAAREEGRDEVVGVELRRVDRLLEVQTEIDVTQRRRAAPTAPAGLRPACPTRGTAHPRAARAPARASFADARPDAARSRARPRARTSAPGSRGASRGPGSAASCAASPHSASPRSGSRERSATSMCTVSPLVGSPDPAVDGQLEHAREPAAAREALGCGRLADERAPVGVVLGESSSSRGTSQSP